MTIKTNFDVIYNGIFDDVSKKTGNKYSYVEVTPVGDEKPVRLFPDMFFDPAFFNAGDQYQLICVYNIGTGRFGWRLI